MCRESNSGASQPMQTKTPSPWKFQYALSNGGSVPCRRATRYWCGASRVRHSASVRRILVRLRSMTACEGSPQAERSVIAQDSGAVAEAAGGTGVGEDDAGVMGDSAARPLVAKKTISSAAWRWAGRVEGIVRER